MWVPGTSFEEIQSGGLGYAILQQLELPIEFRFTNITAALGFATGTFDLFSLRSGFIILGFLSIALLAAILYHSRNDLRPCLIVCVPVAASPFLSNLSYLADEIGFGASLSLISLSLLVAIERVGFDQKVYRHLLGVILGLCAGMLMFEYAGYKLFVLVISLVVLKQTSLAAGSYFKGFISLEIFCYALAFILISWPCFIELYQASGKSFFFDSLRRHFLERESLFVSSGWLHLKEVLSILGGYAAGDSRLIPAKALMVSPALGIVLILCTLKALLQRSSVLSLLLARQAVILIFGLAYFPNNFEAAKIAPIFVSMLGCFVGVVDSWFKKYSIASRGILSPSIIIWATAFVWSSTFIWQAHQTIKLAKLDNHRRGLYSGDEYFACLGVRELSAKFSKFRRVVLFSPRNSAS